LPAELTVRPPRAGDAAYLAEHMRARDRVEVLALIGAHGDLTYTLIRSIAVSPSVGVACRGDEPVFVIGCAAGECGLGVPWLIGTEAANDHPVALTRITKRYISEWLVRWPHLVNAVDARSTANVRWLQRLGFTVQAPKPFGLKGEPFHLFTMGA
jgi:hypothetical protein